MMGEPSVITQEHIHTLQGREVHDRDGHKIGTAGQVWTDAAGMPTWVSVKTGLFGLNESLVPLQDADLAEDRLVVPFDKATVKDAPNVDAENDEPLSQAEVAQLYSYYGVQPHDSYQSYQAGAAASNEYYAGGESGYGRGADHSRDADFARGSDSAGETSGVIGAKHDDTHYETRGTDYEAGAGQGNGRYPTSYADERVTRPEERSDRPGLRRYVTTEQERIDIPAPREDRTEDGRLG